MNVHAGRSYAQSGAMPPMPLLLTITRPSKSDDVAICERLIARRGIQLGWFAGEQC
jgi:hypothetical protein